MAFLATDQSQLGHRGFHMEFKNGYTVSVQWGWMNYCSNRSMAAQYIASHQERLDTPFRSNTAEVLLTYHGAPVGVEKLPQMLTCWKYSFDSNGVAANLSAESVAKLISDVVYLEGDPL